jgi:hypothetical protein
VSAKTLATTITFANLLQEGGYRPPTTCLLGTSVYKGKKRKKAGTLRSSAPVEEL